MNSSENWVLEIDPGVFKTLRRLPQKEAGRILEVIHALPLNPYTGDIEKMKGRESAWRRRVGSYRIFYQLLPRERRILVFNVERRTSATY